MIGKLLLACATSFAIIVFGMPNIEQSRQEARNTQALNLAQQLKFGVLPNDTVDPWGNTFDIQRIGNNEVIVVSRGSNMTTPTAGYDADDISTSMTDPPHNRAMRRKQTQQIGTFTLATMPWLVLLFSAVRGKPEPQQQSSTLPQPKL